MNDRRLIQLIAATNGGDVTIIPTGINRLRFDSDSFTVNRVDYQISGHASLVDGVWEISTLMGNRTPWVAKNYHMTPSAKRKLRSQLPDILASAIDDSEVGMFAQAEADRRNIDEIIIERQIDQRLEEIKQLRPELAKCRRGVEYTPYPLSRRET